MTTREAMIINKTTQDPIIDLDPMDLETTVDGFAVGADATVLDLFDTMVEVEINDETPVNLTLSVVWSDDLTPVRFICPMCDDVRYLDDSGTEDFLDGHTEMVCADCLD